MRHHATVLAAAVAATLVAGCGAVAGEQKTVLAGLAPDRVSTEVFHGESLSLVEYARNTLQARCMAGKGYPQLKQAGVIRQESSFADLDIAAPAFASAGEEHARRFGFGQDQQAQKAHVVSF